MTAADLRPGVIRFESALWETTALALHAGTDAVLVDPGVSAAEIAGIAAEVAGRGLVVRRILVTHADWDHICGISAFPGAPAVMSTGAGERIASGQAAEEVVRLGAAEGLSWDGAPRADLVFTPGEALQVGPFTVETMALPGHTWCGAGFRVRELDVLCVGDYLSLIEFPFVYVSTAAYRATLAALLDALRQEPPGCVVPGHGRALTTDEALRVAREDLAYLHALKAAVRAALESGATREQAIAAGAAVEVPRGASDDTADLRRDNAGHQLAELAPAG